jgi:hypothetical protein
MIEFLKHSWRAKTVVCRPTALHHAIKGAHLHKPSGERERMIAKVLRRLAQGPLMRRQAQVVAGLLGVHPLTVYRLSSRFLKDPNGNSHDLLRLLARSRIPNNCFDCRHDGCPTGHRRPSEGATVTMRSAIAWSVADTAPARMAGLERRMPKQLRHDAMLPITNLR